MAVAEAPKTAHHILGCCSATLGSGILAASIKGHSIAPFMFMWRIMCAIIAVSFSAAIAREALR